MLYHLLRYCLGYLLWWWLGYAQFRLFSVLIKLNLEGLCEAACHLAIAWLRFDLTIWLENVSDLLEHLLKGHGWRFQLFWDTTHNGRAFTSFVALELFQETIKLLMFWLYSLGFFIEADVLQVESLLFRQFLLALLLLLFDLLKSSLSEQFRFSFRWLIVLLREPFLSLERVWHNHILAFDVDNLTLVFASLLTRVKRQAHLEIRMTKSFLHSLRVEFYRVLNEDRICHKSPQVKSTSLP